VKEGDLRGGVRVEEGCVRVQGGWVRVEEGCVRVQGGKHVITYVLSPHVPLLSLPLSAISVMGDKENLKPLFPLPPPPPHTHGVVSTT
jgi:hypothetical protein